ncbi:MAG TPA: AgmX/PglI C-terminal domain-containing protein [Polyangiales bacterium]|nr:AgmX/PglI C-terminal domain-containing protein [Polyangiales bacterium]
MKLVTKQICVVVLAWLGTAACTCEVSLGSPGASDDAPRPTAPTPPTLTQQAAAIDPAVAPASAPPESEPTGVLADASVRKTEARHHNELRFCMEQGATPSDSPQVRIQFVVKDDGSVGDKVEVLERTQAPDRLATCLVQAVKRWKFETPKGGAARATLLLER